jgi:hypothetical protein
MIERANISEFNTIAGLILTELLVSHPIRKDIEPDTIMAAMGVSHPMLELKSGHMFKEMFSATLAWLVQEDFIHSSGTSPRQRAVLTTKALAALNAVPSAIGGRTIGESLGDLKQIEKTEDRRGMIASLFGDFIGAAAASYTKSMGGP